MYQPQLVVEHHKMPRIFFLSLTSCVDSQRLKKFAHPSSSLKVIESFWSPSKEYIVGNQKQTKIWSPRT
jgi:hypothetical protein